MRRARANPPVKRPGIANASAPAAGNCVVVLLVELATLAETAEAALELAALELEPLLELDEPDELPAPVATAAAAEDELAPELELELPLPLEAEELPAPAPAPAAAAPPLPLTATALDEVELVELELEVLAKTVLVVPATKAMLINIARMYFIILPT